MYGGLCIYLLCVLFTLNKKKDIFSTAFYALHGRKKRKICPDPKVNGKKVIKFLLNLIIYMIFVTTSYPKYDFFPPTSRKSASPSDLRLFRIYRYSFLFKARPRESSLDFPVYL